MNSIIWHIIQNIQVEIRQKLSVHMKRRLKAEAEKQENGSQITILEKQKTKLIFLLISRHVRQKNLRTALFRVLQDIMVCIAF